MNDDLSANLEAMDETADHEAGYAYRVVTVREAVERCVSGEWDIPEFQRQFVWRPSQVCGLADSMWRNYPFGALLLWRASEDANGERQVRWWIADGHQRLTSLCILSGREPIWLRRRAAQSPRRTPLRFEPCFDAGADAAPAFVAVRSGAAAHEPRLVPVSRLMALDPDEARSRSELHELVERLKAQRGCRGMDLAELYRRLSRVSMLSRRELVATLVWQQREHVLEIFERLNSRGMRFRRMLLKLAMEEIPAALRGARGFGTETH
jgi:hypothetical protein